MELPFSKYSGCGNDFILIDNRQKLFPAHNCAVIARLCRRPEGIGADGVILIEESQKADFRMRIFNADGSEAEMCGNGLRCLKKFMCELGIEQSSLKIETHERLLYVENSADQIKATMGDPTDIKLHQEMLIDQRNYTVHLLNTGVPHAVYFTEDLETVPIADLGPKMRYHALCAPQGANANFAQVLGPQRIALRTYERGVEAETLACGTGATAAAIAAGLCYSVKPPIRVHTRSGEELLIDFNIDAKSKVSSVTQTGPARSHFRGFVTI